MNEISRHAEKGAHAYSSWIVPDAHHRKPQHTQQHPPIFLPSWAPELNPVENVWQCMRQNWLSQPCLRQLR
ncbi:hypothetical protein FJ546_29265 [Mesorhizobium sp. B2-4-19]|nr:hypothetical protein FJ546_29265 [Mesorhizobium sp. B2-4-19]